MVPFALHIWHSYFLICENVIYWPIGHLCRKKPDNANLPSVRMTNRPLEDGDSGIEIMDNGNGSSEQSDNSSTASSSSVSDTNVLIPESEIKDSGMETEPKSQEVELQPSHPGEEDHVLLLPTTEVSAIEQVATPLYDSVVGGSKSTAESRWTELQQIGMIRFVARPVMFFFLIGSKFSRPKATLFNLAMVFCFILILLSSFIATAFLKPTDRPPQFFKPGSNIQKMLDLSGNLTDTEAINCYSCSAWHSQGPSKSNRESRSLFVVVVVVCC